MSIQKKYNKSKESYQVKFALAEHSNPEGQEVKVVGDFNNWDPAKAPVLKASGGQYQTSLELPAGQRYEFRYLLGQHNWMNDDKADGYTPSPFGYADNCVLDLTKKPKKKKSTTKKSEASKASVKGKATKDKATTTDFKKIEGVGPKIAGILKSAGYSSFELLAKAKKKDLLSILEDAGSRYKMHDPSSWAKQAKLLANNKLDKLKELQAQLKGGK